MLRAFDMPDYDIVPPAPSRAAALPQKRAGSARLLRNVMAYGREAAMFIVGAAEGERPTLRRPANQQELCRKTNQRAGGAHCMANRKVR
jgi:hypothetical protein